MALRQLILGKKIEEKRAALSAAKQKREELEEEENALKEKEAELEEAVAEVTEETSEEDKATLDAAVAEYEQEATALEEKVSAQEQQIEALESEIEELTGQVEEIDERTKRAGAAPKGRTERKEEKPMENRKFFGMNTQERDAFFARSDVKDFLKRLRTMGAEKRAVTGGDLLIPQVVLDIVRQQTEEASKLIKHVNLRSVPGKARQNIAGVIPEAVWTEMCATLNELTISFSAVEVDGYKVGGYIAVCNALLEDSDISLANEIITMLSKAIGLALDKAILYGTGTKMPMGILTRLAQTEKPSDYPSTAREWKDLSATNVLALTGKTEAALFKAIVEAVGAAKSEYSRGELFFAMNSKTHTKLISNALTINAAGAIVTGIDKTMPVIGGAIETLEFIPDDVIIGGYGDLYLLAERAGTSIAQSEHVRFIEDQTVFKATARYDGMPVIPEAFVALGIGGAAPSATAVTFAEDKANAAAGD